MLIWKQNIYSHFRVRISRDRFLVNYRNFFSKNCIFAVFYRTTIVTFPANLNWNLSVFNRVMLKTLLPVSLTERIENSQKLVKNSIKLNNNVIISIIINWILTTGWDSLNFAEKPALMSDQLCWRPVTHHWWIVRIRFRRFPMWKELIYLSAKVTHF